MRLWTIFVHHFKRGGAYHFTLANGNDSPLMLRWRQSLHVATRVFLVGFFFIVVLKNISFKNYSFHHTVHFRHDFKLISNT